MFLVTIGYRRLYFRTQNKAMEAFTALQSACDRNTVTVDDVEADYLEPYDVTLSRVSDKEAAEIHGSKEDAEFFARTQADATLKADAA